MYVSPKLSLTLAALALIAGAAAPAAHAQTEDAALSSSAISVFATGVDSSGMSLANGSGDPHYTLVSVPTGDSMGLQVLTSAFGYPIAPTGPWLGDSSTSAWITPTNEPIQGPKVSGGNYDYETTFTLASFNALTDSASITGGWATDNTGIDILINGVSTGSMASSFSSYSPFTISSGFQSGLNTLDFIVQDDGQGATGLRVDGISGTVNNAPVPEASTTVSLGLLLMLGLGGVLVARRKNNRPLA